MIDAMPRRLLPHLNRQVTRFGKVIWYFRVNKGQRTPLPFWVDAYTYEDMPEPTHFIPLNALPEPTP